MDMSELEDVCILLDKLCLQALMLMEQHIDAKINLEIQMSDGEMHLAKARYILGHSKVSALQIPSENGREISAIARVHSAEDIKLYGQKAFDLDIRKKSTDEDNSDYQDPLRWFGVLVPQDLHKAQTKYRQALIWSVKCVNIQTELHETCVKIRQLRAYKKQLEKSEL